MLKKNILNEVAALIPTGRLRAKGGQICALLALGRPDQVTLARLSTNLIKKIELFTVKGRKFFILSGGGTIKHNYQKKEKFITIIKLPSNFKKYIKKNNCRLVAGSQAAR